MGALFSAQPSPSHYVAAKIRTNLPHLLSRGAKIEKITDTHILVQDIDEWLWQDARTLDRTCKYQLINHVYASPSASADSLNGIVLSITIVPNSTFWALVQGLTAVSTCVFFFMWLNYVYMSTTHVDS